MNFDSQGSASSPVVRCDAAHEWGITELVVNLSVGLIMLVNKDSDFLDWQ